MKIDPEFKNRIPPLSEDELQGLESSIAREGCRDPLVSWEGLLLDGHHRFEICERLGIEYATVSVELPDREAALDWIDRNQLGRRNLSPDQAAEIRGRIYNREKRQDGGHGDQRSAAQNEQPNEDTATRVAKELGVSRSTIVRDGAFAASVERLKPVAPDLERRITIGGSEAPTRKSVVEAAKLVESEPERAAEILKPHVAHNSGDNEWYTPPEILEAARLVLGTIDLDPASSAVANRAVRATRFFSSDDDGLKQSWSGKVWMNPPYAAALIGRFVEKITGHYDEGDIEAAIVLVNNGTETAWGQRLLAGCTSVCFPSSRVRFLKPDGSKGAPLQGQMIAYFGSDHELFEENFADFGVVK